MDQAIIIPAAIITSPIWLQSELQQLRPGGRIPVPPLDSDCIAAVSLLIASHGLPLGPIVKAACIGLQAQVAGWTPAVNNNQYLTIEILRDELAPLRESVQRIERLVEKQEGFRINAQKRSRVESEILPITVNGLATPPDYPAGRVAQSLTRWDIVEALIMVEINCWLRFYALPVRGELNQKKRILWEFLHGNFL